MSSLNKKNWREVAFGDCVDHIELNETNPDRRKNSRYVSVENLETGDLKIRSWIDEEMPTFFRTFKKGQVLFGKRRAYQRKVAIADFDGICSPHIWALEAKNNLTQDYLPYVMSTEFFYEYVNSNSAGTMSPYLKWPQLSKYYFLLPPVEQQRQISSLFQSIEFAIEKSDEQESCLKRLWQKLIDGLASEKPYFGNYLKAIKLRKINFSDVTVKLMRKINPLTYGVERIVAGENLESEDFKIRTWKTIGDGYLGPAFHVLFQPGDILYGSRRTYLKKVALADFEGICSNTTYVIKAKSEILLQDFLKHIMLSERFTQYSIGVSKGSTNPYINWKDLDNFSFQIPDLAIQQMVVDILDSILEDMEQLRQQKQILEKLKKKLLNEILE